MAKHPEGRKRILVGGDVEGMLALIRGCAGPPECIVDAVESIVEGMRRLAVQDYGAIVIDPALLAIPKSDPGEPPDAQDRHRTIANHIVQQVTQEMFAQATLQTIMDTVPVGLIIAESNGSLSYVSPRAVEILGIPAVEIAGAGYPSDSFQLLNPDGTRIAKQEFAIEQALRGVRTDCREALIRRRDGTEVTVLINGAPVCNARGEITGAVVAIHDITHRKQSEEALRQSEERFRNLVEHTNDWIWEINKQGAFTYSSPQVRELLGYEPEEVLGKTPLDLMAPEEASRVRAIFSEIEAKRSPISLLGNTLIRKDGRPVAVETNGSPIFDSQGTYCGYRGIDRDVTERKRLEEERGRHLQELQAANETLQLLNDLASDLLAGASLPHSLDRIIAAAKRMIPADSAAVAVFDERHTLRAKAFSLGSAKCTVAPPSGTSALFSRLRDHYSDRLVIDNDPKGLELPRGHFKVTNVLSLGIPTQDGWARFVLVNKEGGFDQEDARRAEQLGRLAAIVIDRAILDERERAARAEIQRHAAQMESLLSSMVDGVDLMDEHGNVIWMNDAGRAILGEEADGSFDQWTRRYERFTLEGNPLPVEEIPGFRALKGETIRDMRYLLVDREGREIYLSVSAAPVKDSEGRIRGATTVFHDIRTRVLLERRSREQYEHEHHIADTLQHALESVVDLTVPGYGIAADHQPASDEARIGGDFYDVFSLTDDRVALMIGDVAGVGLAAAVYTAMAKYMLRAYARQDPRPEHVMGRLNQAMCDFLPEDMFITLFYGMLDPKTGLLICASAGHELPLLYRKDEREVTAVEIHGAALGLVPQRRYSQRRVELGPGDMLILYTDGIPDARRGGQFFGLAGMRQAVLGAADQGEQAVVGAVLQAAREAADDQLRDDAAILVIRAK